MPSKYELVDNIQELAIERDRIRSESRQLIEARRLQIEEHGAEAVPLQLDALSTAEKVLKAEETFGEDSFEAEQALDGLRLDCQRLISEWYRKNTWEYFPESRHFFDAETGEFFSHGMSIRQMTENALTPQSFNQEEEERRINERVEDETISLIKKMGGVALTGLGVRTISECTDKAITDFQNDQNRGHKHRGYDGYVPEIEKVMIRDITIDPETGDRLEEQIGLPGIYINHDIIQRTLNLRGVDVNNMDKTKLHGSQILVQDDLIEFVELLDEVSSQEWCVPIFMGEKVDEHTVKDYSVIREQAFERQDELKEHAWTVANFVLDLARDGFDKRSAPAHIEEFVKLILLGMAKEDLSLTEQIFDKSTADSLREVVRLSTIGEYERSALLMDSVIYSAPGGGYCSGGSCGLESVISSTERGKELAEKLKAQPGDIIVKDKERGCTKCHRKSVTYAYNSKKVNKYCESCDAFESKVTK